MAEQILVSGWMDYEPADRDRMLGHLVELGLRTREAEPGCLDYAMTADPMDGRRIRVYERWTAQEALDEHFTTVHMKEFRAATSGFVRVAVSLQAHTLAASRDMR